MERPYEGKAKINITAGYCEIIIPSKKSIYLMVFLSIWLTGWNFGVIAVFIQLITNANPDSSSFSLLWLTFAVVADLIMLRKFIWMIFGKEVICIERNELSIQRKYLIPYKKKVYDVRDISNINTQTYGEDGFWGSGHRRNAFKAYSQGTILFDYGMKTIQFGESIHEGEARTIISLLVEKGIIKEEQIFTHIHQNSKNKHWGPL